MSKIYPEIRFGRHRKPGLVTGHQNSKKSKFIVYMWWNDIFSWSWHDFTTLGAKNTKKHQFYPYFGRNGGGGFVFNEVTAYLMLYRKFPITHEIFKFSMYSQALSVPSVYIYIYTEIWYVMPFFLSNLIFIRNSNFWSIKLFKNPEKVLI